MKILVIDFEGSLKNGIKEIGSIFVDNQNKLWHKSKIISNQHECASTLMSIVNGKPELFISHNVQVEKNLLKKYLPYSNLKVSRDEISWGPWLDTKRIYSKLYPELGKYDLPYLSNIFVKIELDKKAKLICPYNKNKPHNALYDALCAFLLFKRIKNIININEFIQ